MEVSISLASLKHVQELISLAQVKMISFASMRRPVVNKHGDPPVVTRRLNLTKILKCDDRLS